MNITLPWLSGQLYTPSCTTPKGHQVQWLIICVIMLLNIVLSETEVGREGLQFSTEVSGCESWILFMSSHSNSTFYSVVWSKLCCLTQSQVSYWNLESFSQAEMMKQLVGFFALVKFRFHYKTNKLKKTPIFCFFFSYCKDKFPWKCGKLIQGEGGTNGLLSKQKYCTYFIKQYNIPWFLIQAWGK